MWLILSFCVPGDSSAETAIQKAIDEVNGRIASGEGLVNNTDNTGGDTTEDHQDTNQSATKDTDQSSNKDTEQTVNKDADKNSNKDVDQTSNKDTSQTANQDTNQNANDSENKEENITDQTKGML